MTYRPVRLRAGKQAQPEHLLPVSTNGKLEHIRCARTNTAEKKCFSNLNIKSVFILKKKRSDSRRTGCDVADSPGGWRLHFDVFTRGVQHFLCFYVWWFAMHVHQNEVKCTAPLACCTTGPRRHSQRSLCILPICVLFQIIRDTDIVVTQIHTPAPILMRRLRPPISGVVPLTSLARFVPFGLGGTKHCIRSVRFSNVLIKEVDETTRWQNLQPSTRNLKRGS